jgi:tetratricopeptide (TPR) repeat protein
MNAGGQLRSRSPSEIIRRGYSDEEVYNIYELGRFSIECGNYPRAETIFKGLIQVTPDYALGWLGMSYITLMRNEHDDSINFALQALKIDPNLTEGLLLLGLVSLSKGDIASAGAYLGDVKDRIAEGKVYDSRIVRLYKLQLARFSFLSGQRKS